MSHSVIVVDDDEIDRYLLKRMIGKTQLDVHVFEKTSGQEALDFFEDFDTQRSMHADLFPPSLCFLDINMPLMSGWEFLEKFATIRIANNLESMAVMMFSSSSDVHDQTKANDFDFVTGYILKGAATPEQLKELILSHKPMSLG